MIDKLKVALAALECAKEQTKSAELGYAYSIAIKDLQAAIVEVEGRAPVTLLTDEQIDAVQAEYISNMMPGPRNFARAIEQAHIAIQDTQPKVEPVISTTHGPWIESTHPGEEGETYCERCLLRIKFFGVRGLSLIHI